MDSGILNGISSGRRNSSTSFPDFNTKSSLFALLLHPERFSLDNVFNFIHPICHHGGRVVH